MKATTEASAITRPVDIYSLGVHHVAQPTMDPEATLRFYVDTMGAKITHCIASKGWRPGHYDYIHMFLEIGKGGDPPIYPDNIAMFYYFGVKSPSEWPRYGTHLSFGARDIAELDRWEAWLQAKGHKIIWRAQYEIMTSIYVWDPNGRLLEIAAQHRTLNDIDAEDAELTAKALVAAAKEQAGSIYTMWEHKARLVEEQAGWLSSPAILFPKVAEFEGLLESARANENTKVVQRGNFVAVEAIDSLRIRRPAGLAEAIWWGAGTGGVKGQITEFNESELVVEA